MAAIPALLSLVLWQAAPVSPLAAATGTMADQLSAVIGVRELRDGRILVVDQREQRILEADLRTGRTAAVGRAGDGPGEYRQLAPILPLRADSGLMIVAGERRWIVFDGSRPVATLPPDQPALTTIGTGTILSTTLLRSLPIQADSLGFLLAYDGVPMVIATREASPADSLGVLRVALATGRSETIARIRQRPTSSRIFSGSDGPPGMRTVNPPWAVGEQALLFPDGWVAIVRLDPYRVEWREPTGRWIRGAPIPITPLPVTATERSAWLATLRPEEARPEAQDWPRTIPPVSHLGRFTVLADAEGRLVVHRSTAASDPLRRYDVVDRTGKVIRQVTVPRNHRLVGFGRGTAYTVRIDDDGLQLVQRHPWR